MWSRHVVAPGLLPRTFIYFSDSTLQNEVIGHFFVILGAKTGVLPKF